MRFKKNDVVLYHQDTKHKIGILAVVEESTTIKKKRVYDVRFRESANIWDFTNFLCEDSRLTKIGRL